MSWWWRVLLAAGIATLVMFPAYYTGWIDDETRHELRSSLVAAMGAGVFFGLWTLGKEL
jgi:hypothetical protein